MNFFRSSLLTAACGALMAVLAASLAGAQTPRIEDIFGPGYLHQVRISPDGQMLAAVASWDSDIQGLVTVEIDTGKTRSLQGSAWMDVYNVAWYGNRNLLFSVSADKIFTYGLYTTPSDDLRRHVEIIKYDVVRVLGQPEARPDRLMLWSKQSLLDRGISLDVEEIELARDERPNRRVYASRVRQKFPLPQRAQVLGLLNGPDGELGLGLFVRDGTQALMYWDIGAQDWRPYPVDPRVFVPLGLDFDRDYVWVATLDQAGSHLRRMRLDSGELEAPIHSDSVYALSNAELRFSKASRGLAGVRYVRRNPVTIWFQPNFAQVQEQVSAALPAQELHALLDWDDSETKFLVYSHGSRQPGLYHVFDATTGQLTRVGESHPAITTQGLRATVSANFRSRDGLNLEAYLTLPSNVSKENPAPLVVLPHGGPWVRDDADYDKEVHFLVSRGYAVLRPNYRGSTGYVELARGDFNADFVGMRNDVIDATQSALRSGLFDPQRLAIMGSSFGGYLALACAVEEPDLFRCAVSFAGVFDWAKHVASKRHRRTDFSGTYDFFTTLLGDVERDREAYEAISPINRLDRVRIPFFLAHGLEDTVVSAKQTRELAAKFRQRGLAHETFFRRYAGHRFYELSDRVKYYQAVEKFLAKHLSPDGARSP